MKKSTKLRLCNRSLLVVSAVILGSGIQLEVIHSSVNLWVWLHIIIGLIFMVLVGIHIFLHFGRSNWFAKFSNLKSRATRILWWVTVLTLITGLASTVRYIATNTHTPLGGIHGKLGFLLIILSIFHIAKRLKFFINKK